MRQKPSGTTDSVDSVPQGAAPLKGGHGSLVLDLVVDDDVKPVVGVLALENTHWLSVRFGNLEVSHHSFELRDEARHDFMHCRANNMLALFVGVGEVERDPDRARDVANGGR